MLLFFVVVASRKDEVSSIRTKFSQKVPVSTTLCCLITLINASWEAEVVIVPLKAIDEYCASQYVIVLMRVVQ